MATTLFREIVPGLRTRPWPALAVPSFGNCKVWPSDTINRASGGSLRDIADQLGDAIACCPKASAIQMGDEREYITLGFGKRVKPAVTVMNHDDDFAVTAIFYRPQGALFQIDDEARFFQHRRAWHTNAQFLDFFLFHSLFGISCRPLFHLGCLPTHFAGPHLTAAKSMRRQGRGGVAGRSGTTSATCPPRRSFPCRRRLASGTREGKPAAS